jgi:hypothetical protein
MRRDQLEHAIRTACQIIGAEAVIVVGSQAILGSVDEGLLPPEATMSLEVDILPIAADEPSTVELADRIEGVAGEWSPFEELHGFSIDGVSLSTAALPAGWRDRLVKVQNANTAAIGGTPRFTGWCLERHDLCVAKLVALREKDANFVASLLAAGLVDPTVIAARLDHLDPVHALAAERAKSWLASWA